MFMIGRPYSLIMLTWPSSRGIFLTNIAVAKTPDGAACVESDSSSIGPSDGDVCIPQITLFQEIVHAALQVYMDLNDTPRQLLLYGMEWQNSCCKSNPA